MSPKENYGEQPSQQEWEELPPVPPDGGWGWIIVIAALFCNIIIDGTTMSFGVYLVALQEHFGEGKGKTAWVGSLVPGLYMATGPLVSALCNKFSCQVVTIIGAILASLFFFLSTFSPNLNTLIFVYGVMGGISMGLMYLPSIVIVGLYFEKRRALATGLAVCGSGIGTMLFAPLFQVLLDKYGWQGSFWIISGVLLNGVVCGALFRPLRPRKVWIGKPTKELSSQEIDVSLSEQSETSEDSCEVQCHAEVSQHSKHIGRVRSEECISKMPPPPTNRRTRTVSEGYHYSKREKSRDSSKFEKPSSLNLSIILTRAARPLYREDIFFCGSLNSIPDYRHPPSNSLAVNTSYMPNLPSIPEEGMIEKQDDEESWMTPLVDVLKNIFNFSIFKEISFILLCLGSITAVGGILTPYLYLSAMANDDLGISPDKATWLVSVLGISNTVGRVIFGWMNDRSWADSVLIYNIAPIACGIVTCLVPLMKTYVVLTIYCFVFGSFLAAYVTLRTIVLTQLYGISRLSNAFGLLLLFQGIAALVGSPIAGLIYDCTNSYEASFISSGSMMILGGLVSLPCQRVARWQQEKWGTEVDKRSDSRM